MGLARRYLAAILVASSTMRSDAALASAPAIQRRRAVISPSGFELEWLSYPAPPESAPAGSTGAPGSTAAVAPVLFIHGSFHGAWCWEQWMERFSTSLGCTCHAVSLRGTSGSPCDQRSVKISEHVADLAAFVNGPLATETGSVRPLIVGHSFGGASLLKYLEADHPASAAVLLCSVPPSGNSQMTLRFLKRSPLACWRLLRGFAFKAAARDPSIARDLFFDHAMSDDQIDGYLARFAEDCKVGIDLGAFNKDLPSLQAREDGRAQWLHRAPPTLVVGAERDAVVDLEGVQETAAFLGISAKVLEGLPHDCMLAAGWEGAADQIIEWVKAQASEGRQGQGPQ